MRAAAFLPLAALWLSACNPADRRPQTEPGKSAVEPRAVTTPPANQAEPAAPVESGAPAPAPDDGPRPYIAELRQNVPVINLLSRGRLEVVDDCLTVLVIGGRATAVLPPGVRRVMSGRRLVAVEYEGRRIPVGPMTAIPGGGVTPDEISLKRPLPARCPAALWGLGG